MLHLSFVDIEWLDFCLRTPWFRAKLFSRSIRWTTGSTSFGEFIGYPYYFSNGAICCCDGLSFSCSLWCLCNFYSPFSVSKGEISRILSELYLQLFSYVKGARHRTNKFPLLWRIALAYSHSWQVSRRRVLSACSSWIYAFFAYNSLRKQWFSEANLATIRSTPSEVEANKSSRLLTRSTPSFPNCSCSILILSETDFRCCFCPLLLVSTLVEAYLSLVSVSSLAFRLSISLICSMRKRCSYDRWDMVSAILLTFSAPSSSLLSRRL